MYGNLFICVVDQNNYIKFKIDYETIQFHEFLLFHFNFCYDLIKKSLFERTISYEKSINWFKILKFSKGQKILKNLLKIFKRFKRIYNSWYNR